MLEPLTFEDARRSLARLITALQHSDPEAFCNPNSVTYRDLHREIAATAWNIKCDPNALAVLLDSHTHSIECWLPLDRHALTQIAAVEVLARLQINCSGERWVNGALIEAFKTGTLMMALERIQSELAEVMSSSNI